MCTVIGCMNIDSPLLRLLAPVVSGGLAGAIVTLTINQGIGCWRRWRLRAKMLIHEASEHNRVVTVRVRNGHIFPLSDCWAYISLRNVEAADIMAPVLKRDAHIRPDVPFPLEKDRLCWSVLVGGGNPGQVTICPHESQSLQVFEVFPKEANPNALINGYPIIAVFSETRGNPYRVFLRGNKVYEGVLQVVCKETFTDEFHIRISPAQQTCRLEILGRVASKRNARPC